MNDYELFSEVHEWSDGTLVVSREHYNRSQARMMFYQYLTDSIPINSEDLDFYKELYLRNGSVLSRGDGRYRTYYGNGAYNVYWCGRTKDEVQSIAVKREYYGEVMHVLGLDLATKAGVFLGKFRSRDLVASHGWVIDLNGTPRGERSAELVKSIQEIMQPYRVDLICLEEPVYVKNINSFKLLMELWSVTRYVLETQNNIPCISLPPAEARKLALGQALTGEGESVKTTIMRTFQRIYKVNITEDNVCDAAVLACAGMIHETSKKLKG